MKRDNGRDPNVNVMSPGGGAGLGPSDFDHLFHQPSFPDVFKYLLQRGDQGAILMRTIFPDRRFAMAVSMYREQLLEFDLKEEVEALDLAVSSLVSVGGEGRNQAVESAVGQLRSDSARRSLFDRWRNKDAAAGIKRPE